MIVRKANGITEEFDPNKVKSNIEQIASETKEFIETNMVDAIVSNLFLYENIETSEIRRQVENSLMSINKNLAKSYIKKFGSKEESNSKLKKKNDFMAHYIKSSNPATGSKFDSNANVAHKNIVTMGQELYKEENIRQNRWIMQDKIRGSFGHKLADKYLEDLESHIIYRHDETAIPGMPYCVAITMYPFLIDGLKTLGGVSKAPTDSKSFTGEFINLVYSISSQFAGAVATPEYLMYLDYFLRKDYGEDYNNNLYRVVDLSNKERTVEKTIENLFQQVVHSMNMPAGNRGYQTVFWNIGYFDKFYFEGIFKDFVFPDGTKPKWETVSWIQKKFMKWFNQERTKYALTFPVETMALLTDGENPVDTEYGDFSAEMWSEGHSFFCYLSDSVDSLSSCCFSKDQKTLTRSSAGINFMTFEELHNSKYKETKRNFTIFHNGSWVKGKTIKLPNTKMLKITTSNNKEIIVSHNHLNPTLRGDISTENLTTDDYLLFNTNKLDSHPEVDLSLTYEQGIVVGAFLGDGSFGSRREMADGSIKIREVGFSLNGDCIDILKEYIDKANKQMGGSNELRYTTFDKLYASSISSIPIVNLIQAWTHGISASTKKLNLECLTQSYEFRKGIIDGWYLTDGGNSNRCYTVSTELRDTMEVLLTSIGYISIINEDDRTDQKAVFKGVEYNKNFPLWCIRWYNPKNKRSMKDVYYFRNNSIYFKINSIEEVEYSDDIYCFEMDNIEEPYFTLPNGIITHNCRLRNSISTDNHNHTTHQFSMGTASVATGSKSVMTINLNRVIQNAVNQSIIKNNFTESPSEFYSKFKEECKVSISESIGEIVQRIHKYQEAFNDIIKDFLKANMLDVYSAGYIDMKKQYLTLGVNGLTDAAEFLGISTNLNEDYKDFVNNILEKINVLNAAAKTKELMYNTEFVPGESLSNKNYNWDKRDGYFVSQKHNMYSSYFFNPEDQELSVIDKMKLHGKDFVKYLDGGSACHLNLNEHLSKEQYKSLLKIAIENGTNYFTFNVKNTACNECGYISKHTLTSCPKCNSTNLDYLTRIIGYLKRVSSFSEARQLEAGARAYNDQV